MNVTDITNIGRKNYVFKNWAGIYSCRPSLYFQPETIEEVVEIVKQARTLGKTVVTVGSGHSPSNMCITSEWLVNLDKLNKVEELIEYPSLNYADISVEAGIRIYQINEWVAKHDYAIQNLGSISEQSVAGIISTGTHGSSQYHGLVSSNIVNLTIVDGKGDVLFLDSNNHPEVFKAALLSLGKIGIIVRATLRVVPAFNLKATEDIIDFETLIERWDSLWTSSEFIRVWWYPYTKKCVLWRANKTQEEPTPPRKSWWGTTLGRFFYESLLWVSVRIYGPLTPYIERFVFNRQYGQHMGLGNGVTTITTSVEGFNMDCLFSQFVNEWACPLVNGPEVLRSLEHSIDQACQHNEFYTHVPVEIRCSNTTLPSHQLDSSDRTRTSPGPVYGNIERPYLDNTALECRYTDISNVTNSQLTMYINATIYRPFGYNTKISKWYNVFETTMAAAGGKPHWAKNFLGNIDITDGQISASEKHDDFEGIGMGKKFREWYGNNFEDFKKVREQIDPDGVFLSNKDWTLRNGILDSN